MTIQVDPRRTRRFVPTLLASAVVLACGVGAWRVALDPGRDLRRAEAADRPAVAAPARARLSRAAIHAAPLDGRGYRMLAEAELSAGREPDAARLFAIAGDRGPRDIPTQRWLASRALKRGDYAGALSRFDQMLRVQPQLAPRLYPVLMALALQPKQQAEVARLLRRQPPWRQTFMQNLFRSAPDNASLFALVEALRLPGAARGAAAGTATGLTPEELRLWLDRLVAGGDWSPAYLTWVDSLEPGQRRRIGNVYNGGFELEPSQLGFDWRFGRVPGVQISREQVTGAEGVAALRVAFEDRRVPFQDVRQLLYLPAGAYRFSGRARLDQLRSERGLVWRLSCAGDGRVIAETPPFSGNHGWRDFELPLSVPADACSAQWLTLLLPARIPAEQRIGGDAWFDALEIERTAAD